MLDFFAAALVFGNNFDAEMYTSDFINVVLNRRVPIAIAGGHDGALSKYPKAAH